MQGWTATKARIYRKKKHKKITHTENLFRKNLQLKGVCYFETSSRILTLQRIVWCT